MEYEISPDYMPICPSALRTNTMVGCDIYMLAKTSVEIRFVLYCKSDAVFDEAKKEMLLAQRIKSVFIKKEEQNVFFDYLENNFELIITDASIPSDEKTKIVHGAATNLVKDLFEDPRSGSIERTKTFAHNMVDYVIKDPTAAESLMKIAVHEYYTYTHSVNVAAVGTLFGQNLGLGVADLKGFCAGILLHDVGKTRINTDILNKKGKLTKEEFEEVKKHPELGIEVLDETGTKFKEERIVTLQHHENFDGSGYPYGLAKDEIHLCGKISRVIDVYDALTTKRSYKDASRPFAALTEMKDSMFQCFDPELFKEFIQFLGPYDPRKTRRETDRWRP
ncbi:MAG: HD-GYP domain-containing protein [Candidatus Scalindua sp.]|nr:HD-GYP domain-containing protein [Candidatus Scalindua sp.]